FHHVLREMTQYRIDGREEYARGQWLAIRDFFAGVRGKSPHAFGPASLTAEQEDSQSKTIPAHKKKILVWSESTDRKTLDLARQLEHRFPLHTVDILVPIEIQESLDFESDRLIRKPARRFYNRARLAAWALRRYDTIARHEARTRLAFEYLLPVLIWYSENGKIRIQNIGPSKRFAIFLSRLWISPAAVFLCLRALLKPRPRVDYFTWSNGSDHPHRTAGAKG
ncbi:hypothetical protein HQ520_05520, partial [bacterium]|nr:hypothetical protein [bacterium]